MNARRLSTMLSAAGGVLLVAAATFLVSVSFGEISTTSVDANDRLIDTSHRTASVLQDSPRFAVMWILIAAGFALLAAVLVRYGGIVGPVAVLAVTGLALLASILTIGIFLAPGFAALDGAALAGIVDWDQRRRLVTAPPPPPPSPMPPPCGRPEMTS